MPLSSFTEEAIEAIRDIPAGRVATYGGMATMAGNPRAARQVARILHSCAEREGLPWWRVVKREGTVALKPGYGYEEQVNLLLSEGITFDDQGRIDLTRFLWNPLRSID